MGMIDEEVTDEQNRRENCTNADGAVPEAGNSEGGVFRFVKSYRFERHNHRETEIVYIKSGHCIMGVGKSLCP